MSKIVVPDYLDKLIKELPDEGPSQDLSHEIARAYNKIIWDYYNNGFGNDLMPAFMFLSVLENIYNESDDISQYESLLLGLGIHISGARPEFINRIKSELNSLGKLVEKIIHSYESDEDEIHGIDFWNFDSWSYLLDKCDIYSGSDNSKAFNYDFTDVLEQIIDTMCKCNCLEHFRDIMDNASKYFSNYRNGSYNLSKDELREELENYDIDEDDAEWYVNEFPNQLSRSRPLWY